jgi:adenylate cyclase
VPAVVQWERLVELGLYDADAPDADDRRELLEYLTELGLTPEDMVEAAAGSRLQSAPFDRLIRPGRPELTLEEAAARIGLTPELLSRLWRAAGFVEPPPGTVSWSDADVEAFGILAVGIAYFGEEASLQLARVFGASLARMAEAAFRSALANVEGAYGPGAESPVAVARSSADLGLIAQQSGVVLDVFFRRHLDAVVRASDGLLGGDAESAPLAIGFVDLVSSTNLTRELEPSELARAMSEFDALSSDVAAEHGGRVVKLIGDEVMFIAPTADAAAAIALDLVVALDTHPVLPPARGAIGAGLVTLRDGDYFGPVVNLAARLVHLATPGHAVAPAELTRALDPAAFVVSSAGTHSVRGFGDPVAIGTIARADRT